jgi:GT2 family glycosyltransferase/uncharacterized membrane protein YqaE (UPF0057 family)
MSQNLKLSIIIVNYNVKYFLEQALLSVEKAIEGVSADVWVVDNNSIDGSVSMVEEQFPWVKLIANKDNPGFSIANNQAIRKSDAEYVLLLNPDTVVEEDTFKKCIEYMDDNPGVGGLGVRMIDGAGVFLPESKRGFPSPMVAFSKAFGLSKLFPKSKVFNTYHLGYLSEWETAEVDVLAGAYMFMRKETLDKVGLLDETFFMYGEDIDLSYRITLGGYSNVYFPETSIIHYKGESTKKGSLNYVKAFYQAMIIFARKHFKGRKASSFVTLIQFAIYFKAFMTLVGNLFNKYGLALLDATIGYIGLLTIERFWSAYHFQNLDYFDDSLKWINYPIYVLFWLVSTYYSGGYDVPYKLRRLIRGILFGSLLLTSAYGLLPAEWRPSRAVILLGAAWMLTFTISFRILRHFLKNKDLRLGGPKDMRMLIVGEEAETVRVKAMLHQVGARKNILGILSPLKQEASISLGSIENLEEIVKIYNVEELVFCSSNIPSSEIMKWMSKLGSSLEYKIVPKDSQSIIGSSSKNTSGEIYTVDIRFNIDSSIHRRNKRVLDFIISIVFLLISPILVLLQENKMNFIRNIFLVLLGYKTWIGYSGHTPNDLPKIKKSILGVADSLDIESLDESTQRRLDFLYAKDYEVGDDLLVILKAWRKLGYDKP